MDFVISLFKVNGFDAVFNVVDRLSKFRYIIFFINISAKGVIKLFIDNIWKHYGFPKSCITDKNSLLSGGVVKKQEVVRKTVHIDDAND